MGGNVLTDAFGVAAMVAMTPLITIQIMGLIYARQTRKATMLEMAHLQVADEVIVFEEVGSDE